MSKIHRNYADVYVHTLCVIYCPSVQSEVWIDDPDQKSKLVGAYKGNLS